MARKSSLLLRLAAIVAVVALRVEAKDCTVKPLVLETGNVTVADYPNKVVAPFQRVLAIEVGEQGQTLAVGLSTGHNLTFVSDSATMCGKDKGYWGCVFWRGGVYGYNESDSSFVKDTGTTANVNGSASNEGWDTLNSGYYQDDNKDPLAQFLRGWDSVRFADGPEIQGYPLSVITDPMFPFSTGSIGLATDSVFLKTMVSTKNAPSLSFSIDSRSTAINKETNGEFIIGGYNTDKVSWEDFTNFTVFEDKSKPCPLQVRVKNIKWGEYLSYDESFPACIEPGLHTNTLPLSFQKAWNETWLEKLDYTWWKESWELMMYNITKDSKDVPEDDLEFELEGGYKSKISIGELFRQGHVVNNSRGGWDPVKRTIQTYFGDGGSPDKDPPSVTLGRLFLSQSILAVDYENMKFSLAPSPQTEGDNPVNPNVKALGCDDVTELAELAENQGSDGDSGGDNKGAIIGGVVGGVLGALALLGLLWFFLRRRKQRKTPQAEAAEFKQEPVANQPVMQEFDRASEAPGSPGMRSPTGTIAPAYDSEMYTGAGWSHVNKHQHSPIGPGTLTSGVSSFSEPAELTGETRPVEMATTGSYEGSPTTPLSPR